jgi:hypothetical protein
MLKSIIWILVQTHGFRAINKALGDVSHDRINPYRTDEPSKNHNDFHDELAEAYDTLNYDFFEMRDFADKGSTVAPGVSVQDFVATPEAAKKV